MVQRGTDPDPTRLLEIQREAFEILAEVGAILREGHFVGTSGRHMEIYINKDVLLRNPKSTERITKLMAERCSGIDIDVVVAPSVGAIILGNRTAGNLSTDEEVVPSLYTEKDPDGLQIFKREGSVEIVKGQRVLIVEDTAATGLSLRRTIEAVQAAGGIVVGACLMVNRDTKRINSTTMGVPVYWLVEMDVPTYDRNECPLCAAGRPIAVGVGHGKTETTTE